MAPARICDGSINVAIAPTVAVGVESTGAGHFTPASTVPNVVVAVRAIHGLPASVLACPNAVGFHVDGDPAPTTKGSERQSAERDQG